MENSIIYLFLGIALGCLIDRVFLRKIHEGRFLCALQSLELKPGHHYVLTTERSLTIEQAAYLRELWDKHFLGVKAVFLNELKVDMVDESIAFDLDVKAGKGNNGGDDPFPIGLDRVAQSLGKSGGPVLGRDESDKD